MAALRETQSKAETKGARSRRRIMDEARAMIDHEGIVAVSQEAVAKRAGLTQSALRHHFPTKEAMFDAIFDHVFSSFYESAERIMLNPEYAPRERLMKLVAQHLDYVTRESDRVALESFAHYLNSDALLVRQSSWYHWIAGHYAALIGTLRPDLDEDDRRRRALGILTLSIGAWITIGRSRPDWPGLPGTAARDALAMVVEQLIDG